MLTPIALRDFGLAPYLNLVRLWEALPAIPATQIVRRSGPLTLAGDCLALKNKSRKAGLDGRDRFQRRPGRHFYE